MTYRMMVVFDLDDEALLVEFVSHCFPSLKAILPEELAAGLCDIGLGIDHSDGFESVAFFPEDLNTISGVITEESLDRLGQSTWLAQVGVGRGSLILFVEDPLFRMFWYTGFQPYTNAILFGAGS